MKSLAMAALFVGLGSTAFAQQTATAPASAVVLSDLTITLDGAQNAIDFGNLSATTGDIKLDAKGTANVNTGTRTNVARFDLRGDNSAVTVSYDATVALKRTERGATLYMRPEVVGAALETAQSAAVPVPTETTVVLDDNAYFLWVGGSISALNGQAAGTYKGTFNIAVEYN